MTDASTLVGTLANLHDRVDDLQTDMYIVAGVLGPVAGILLVFSLVMICVTRKVLKKVRDTEERLRIANEMNRRRFSAYTGEEVHRQLKMVAPNTKESEYAFNQAFVSPDY